MSESVNVGMRDRLESPMNRVLFRTSSDHSCTFLCVLLCVCGSRRPGEPGVAAGTLLGLRVEDSDLWDVLSILLFILVSLIIVSFSTSVILSVSQGTAADSSGSL